jgi:uncharacterized protein (UPF0276 family)
MLLALNYSPQAADLLNAGRIAIDRFKCPPWPDMLAVASELRPVCVHFELRAGRAATAGADWDAMARFMERYDTPYLNLHLAPSAEEFPELPADSADSEHLQLVAEHVLADVEAATRRFGASRVIVENIPYRAGGKLLRAAAEPQLIGDVVRATGCGLLLDISHARISAASMAIDEREYMRQLPVDRIRELHITGTAYDEAGVLRDHLAMREEDWPVVEWVLERFRAGEWAQPWMVALEYGGIGPIFVWRSESAVIAADVPRLHEKIHG